MHRTMIAAHPASAEPLLRLAGATAMFAAAVLAAGAVAGCRGRAADDARAAEDLKALERTLLDLADVQRRPRLSAEDLGPLREQVPSDHRVRRVHETCLEQYEDIVRLYEELAECAALTKRLEATRFEPGLDLAAARAILDEANTVCARSFRSTEHIERARGACDRGIAGIRRSLGLEPR